MLLTHSHFIFAVALKHPTLLENILGKTVVEAAWQQIMDHLQPKFKDLFSRYLDVTQQRLDHYLCSTMAKINHQDSLFDQQEQTDVILATGQHYLYEALVEYFSGGSGRKIEFVVLLKCIDDPSVASEEQLRQWTANEGLANAVMVETHSEQMSPYCNISRAEFTQLLSDRKLQTYVQSIVQLKDESIVGYEVLTRGPKGSEVERADKLFGSAAHFGLTKEIELACIIQALTHLPRLPDALFLTFNVGPEVLASHELAELLKRSSIQPYLSKIAFELTEHLPLANLEQVRTAVNAMQALGIKIFLDDTGCGFFDISTAEALAPSVVKLCISVIRRIDDGEEIKHEVCDTRKRLDELGAMTLGEGVEERFQADFLKNVGVQYAQGYLFDKPRPIEEVI